MSENTTLLLKCDWKNSRSVPREMTESERSSSSLRRPGWVRECR